MMQSKRIIVKILSGIGLTTIMNFTELNPFILTHYKRKIEKMRKLQRAIPVPPTFCANTHQALNNYFAVQRFLVEPHITMYPYYCRSFSQPGVTKYSPLKVDTTNIPDRLQRLTCCCASEASSKSILVGTVKNTTFVGLSIASRHLTADIRCRLTKISSLLNAATKISSEVKMLDLVVMHMASPLLECAW